MSVQRARACCQVQQVNRECLVVCCLVAKLLFVPRETKEKKREKSKKLKGLGELRGKRDQIEGGHRAVARRGREQMGLFWGKRTGFRFVLFASTLLCFSLFSLLQVIGYWFLRCASRSDVRCSPPVPECPSDSLIPLSTSSNPIR